MQTVADLMTSNLITLDTSHTMKNAHDLINKKGIRHLPVLSTQPDESGHCKMVGLVTQKEMIARVINFLATHGADALFELEMRTPVMDIAVTDFEFVDEDEPLRDVAYYFLKNKLGCLPVFNKNSKLTGMITSSDFVKLSAALLS